KIIQAHFSQVRNTRLCLQIIFKCSFFLPSLIGRLIARRPCGVKFRATAINNNSSNGNPNNPNNHPMIMESRSKVNSASFESDCLTPFLGSQHSEGKEKKHWYGNMSEGQKQALEVGLKF